MHLPYPKRLFDIVLSSGAIITLMPLMAGIAIVIKISDPKGKVIYTAPRVGQYGKKFMMYKFRTMVSNAEELKKELEALNECKGAAFKITNDPRVTRVGRFLRKYALDELPQFFNVLKGDMSIVGPRPPDLYDYNHYEEWQKERLKVKPGMTSLWHVSGCPRDFNKQCKTDIEYTKNIYLSRDLKILWRTFGVVISGSGI